MRRLLTALIAIAFFISCSPGGPHHEPPKTHHYGSIITRGEAAKLMSAFLNHPKLGSYAVQKNVGGIFERSVFELDDTKAGALLWFCYDAKESEEKQWYLAATKVTGYTPAVTRDATDELWKPYDFFKYTGPGTSVPDVIKFIETHQYGEPGKSPVVSAAEVRVQVEDFMKVLLPTFDPDPEKLQKYPFTFFGEMSEDFQIRKLLAQPGAVGIRYYYGYQETDDNGKDLNNKIRVIMCAIDQYGKNILGTKGDDGDIMIEKSFPPPPDQNG
jgi:hypothetical protein